MRRCCCRKTTAPPRQASTHRAQIYSPPYLFRGQRPAIVSGPSVRLAMRQTGAEIRGTLPASRALLPPGYYMLFVVNDKGVPSVARFVRVS
jgi:hypothetical protein